MPLTDSAQALAAWLRLSLESLGAAALHLLRHVGAPEVIFSRSATQLAAYVPAEIAERLARPPQAPIVRQIDHALRWAEQDGHTLLPLCAAHYPAHLLTIGDAPLLLYVDGQLGALRVPGVAIVGARQATVQGRENARAFAQSLARHGLCVISGLAAGIDAAAHEGALAPGDDGAGTIAVTGTGLDHVYPPQHIALAARIRQHGAVVSEFPLGMAARPHHFPRRNRIVAGLARGVLIVEAAAKSGSLITARLANETGRDVFALPGSIHSPLARGCHELIRQGATLVETVDDILAEFAEFQPPRQASLPGNPAKRAPRASRPCAPPFESAPFACAAGARATDAWATGASEADVRATDAWATGASQAEARAPDASATEASGVEAHSPDRWAVDASGPPAAFRPPCPLLEAIGYDPVGLDALLAHTARDAATLACELLSLELAGTIHRLADGRYQRVQR